MLEKNFYDFSVYSVIFCSHKKKPLCFRQTLTFPCTFKTYFSRDVLLLKYALKTKPRRYTTIILDGTHFCLFYVLLKIIHKNILKCAFVSTRFYYFKKHCYNSEILLCWGETLRLSEM